MTRAVRVRKARSWSLCALCPAVIQTGQLIGKIPAGGWAHAACIIATQKTTAASPAADTSRSTP